MIEYRVLIHYHSQEGRYAGANLWQWKDGDLGREVSFTTYDYFGMTTELTYHSQGPLSNAKFLIKAQDWSWQSRDFEVQLLPVNLRTEVWVIEGDDTLYYSRQAAMASPRFRYRNPHAFDMANHAQGFDQYWAYQGWLGARYESEASFFKVWAPTAKQVDLVVYTSAANDAPVWKIYPMERGSVASTDHAKNDIGVWYARVTTDIRGLAYQYHVYQDFDDRLTRDPYAQAATEDGLRSVLLAEEDRAIPNFILGDQREATWRIDQPTKAVIYEMHVRDLTKSPTSGVPASLRGTYLGAAYPGAQTDSGQATGLDYIKRLGVNYVQLQPIADRFKQYDSNGQVLYNWGYDPQNYNVPESSLSNHSHSPAQVIRDLKTMIKTYHDAGIGVILDVVYNHVYSTHNSPFQDLVPDYYFRMAPDGSFENGTGVGSETASEHAMFRKYMLDSLRYWVEEYQVDGFRFDLMGIHDVETMNQIRQAMDEIDPRILLYGEGWDMGTVLSPEEKAKKDNAFLMPRIGFFNDDQRDALKGSEVFGHLKAGFVSGQGSDHQVVQAFKASRNLGSYLTPSQVLNYVQAHDNYNLHDLLQELHPGEDVAIRWRRQELATVLNLLMPGMTFMEAGQEFGRTKLRATGPDGQVTQDDKERAMNSYNAPDAVNQIDWSRLDHVGPALDRIQTLIALKETESNFSPSTYEEVEERLVFGPIQEGAGRLEVTFLGSQKDYRLYLTVKEPIPLEKLEEWNLVVSNQISLETGNLEPLHYALFEKIV
ncbi:type I pullulanase [Streptococcus sp. 121]|uniref:type I pullulanase n=1 Tax=Streptococcus sp. 121 TaxID=2797637 RepID=UPI0018F0E547|nr:type I pullulanase [Streptococcus sp. 121]MBJ6745652.1 type I pullulanase [Streptococcus sp. 121]